MTTRTTPLLLLHTWGGDATTWAPALGHLGAGGRHLTAPDLPGHGARAAEPFTVGPVRRRGHVRAEVPGRPFLARLRRL
ncbi:hypothetical protein AB0E17_35230, partial [Streptomyces niveus]